MPGEPIGERHEPRGNDLAMRMIGQGRQKELLSSLDSFSDLGPEVFDGLMQYARELFESESLKQGASSFPPHFSVPRELIDHLDRFSGLTAEIGLDINRHTDIGGHGWIYTGGIAAFVPKDRKRVFLDAMIAASVYGDLRWNFPEGYLQQFQGLDRDVLACLKTVYEVVDPGFANGLPKGSLAGEALIKILDGETPSYLRQSLEFRLQVWEVLAFADSWGDKTADRVRKIVFARESFFLSPGNLLKIAKTDPEFIDRPFSEAITCEELLKVLRSDGEQGSKEYADELEESVALFGPVATLRYGSDQSFPFPPLEEIKSFLQSNPAIQSKDLIPLLSEVSSDRWVNDEVDSWMKSRHWIVKKSFEEIASLNVQDTLLIAEASGIPDMVSVARRLRTNPSHHPYKTWDGFMEFVLLAKAVDAFSSQAGLES